MESILVVNLTRFGDIVQTTPMLQGLKSVYPESRVSLLVNNNCEQLCSLLPGIDEYYTLDFKQICTDLHNNPAGIEQTYSYLKEFFGKLRLRNFNKVINITPHHIGVISAFLAGQGNRLNENISAWTKFFISTTRNWKTLPMHVIDLYSKMAGLDQHLIVPKLNASQETYQFASNMLQHQGIDEGTLLLGLHTGGSTDEKRWPQEHFIELCERIIKNISCKMILYGVETENNVSTYLLKNYPGQVISMLGKTTPEELTAFMHYTDVLITNDSGPMHVATACGTKVLSLHTGKEKCISTGPYGEGNLAIEPDMACHPCEFPESCHSLECRNRITPDSVFAALEILLGAHSETHTEALCAQKGVQLFCSGFDANGFMDFYPLQKKDISFEKLSVYMQRVLWSRVLAETEAGYGVPRLGEKAVVNIYRYIQKHYHTHTVPDLLRQWNVLLPHFIQLKRTAGKGGVLADEVHSAGMNPVPNISRLQHLTQQLEALDNEVISAGEMIKPFKNLIHLFLYEKEIIEGGSITDMAVQTRTVYEVLVSRINELEAIGQQLFILMNR